ncbi:hypothetical protein DPEC_G00012620 [Dallia pectoralis]|uniref:Uncharacterized protein n=1 Tax=Dallia pectoralis TaxID=75939 RepID=A0ACC2HMS8_DALPE|nr:hypothetical protein DPEC_G00012620 [Dallia pectoralis]
MAAAPQLKMAAAPQLKMAAAPQLKMAAAPQLKMAAAPQLKMAAAPQLKMAAAPQLKMAAAPQLKMAAAPQLKMAAAPQLKMAAAPQLKMAAAPQLKMAAAPQLKMAAAQQLKMAAAQQLKMAAAQQFEMASNPLAQRSVSVQSTTPVPSQALLAIDEALRKDWESERMELVTLLLLIIAIVPVVYCCDPNTQYEKYGDCCSMCGPGTRVSSPDSNCFDPICIDCVVGEYQPEYTKETKCKLQPVCDKNVNFEVKKKTSMTSLSPCQCKAGHHCSSTECLTCVPHTKCGPGQEIQTRGDHIRDTVCQTCPANTFSNGSAADDVCTQWTECKSGFITQATGTPTSDRVCVPAPTSYTIQITGIVLGIILSLVIIVLIWKKRERLRDAYHKAMETCMECLRSNCFPTQAGNKDGRNAEGHEEHLEQLQPIIETLPEQCPGPQTPVEDDVNDSQDRSYSVPQEMTENGHVVAQEEGKAHHTSVCDSQMSVVISL